MIFKRSGLERVEECLSLEIPAYDREDCSVASVLPGLKS